MVQNLPLWRASSLLFLHWEVKTKRPQPVKLDWPLFLCPSMGIIMSLPSSMADFVPCDHLLQKAYRNKTIIITTHVPDSIRNPEVLIRPLWNAV